MKTQTPKKGKTVKIIANVLYGVFILSAVALIAFLFFGRLQNRVTFIFDRAVIWILSPSMEGEIPAHSYILIKKTGAANIEKDDIITFYSDDPALSGALNTHRVLEVIGNHEEFITKGDNSPAKDPYTAKADKIVGKYQRNLGFFTVLMKFFMTKFGLVTLILVFICFIGAAYVPALLKKPESDNDKSVK